MGHLRGEEDREENDEGEADDHRHEISPFHGETKGGSP
jgi:hypothetical protein